MRERASAACSAAWYTAWPVAVAISADGESGASGVNRIVYTTDGTDPAINGSDVVTNGTAVAGASVSLNVTTLGPTTGAVLRVEACGICGSDVEQY